MPSVLILDEHHKVTALPSQMMLPFRHASPPHRHNYNSQIDESEHYLHHYQNNSTSNPHDEDVTSAMGVSTHYSATSSNNNDHGHSTSSVRQLHPPQHDVMTVPSRDALVYQEAMKVLKSSTSDLFDILAVLKHLPHDAYIQTKACEKLWILSWDDETAMTIGRTKHGIPLILHAMTRFPTHSHLQQCAAQTLQNLAALNQYNCQQIIKLGGVKLLSQAMKRDLVYNMKATADKTTTTTSLQICGCSTIASLAESTGTSISYRNKIMSDGGADAVLHASRCFALTDPNVVMVATQALHALGYDPANMNIIEL